MFWEAYLVFAHKMEHNLWFFWFYLLVTHQYFYDASLRQTNNTNINIKFVCIRNQYPREQIRDSWDIYSFNLGCAYSTLVDSGTSSVIKTIWPHWVMGYIKLEFISKCETKLHSSNHLQTVYTSSKLIKE